MVDLNIPRIIRPGHTPEKICEILAKYWVLNLNPISQKGTNHSFCVEWLKLRWSSKIPLLALENPLEATLKKWILTSIQTSGQLRLGRVVVCVGYVPFELDQFPDDLIRLNALGFSKNAQLIISRFGKLDCSAVQFWCGFISFSGN